MARKLANINKIPKETTKFHRPEGAGNFDNMDDMNIVNQINIKTGTVNLTPTEDKHIVNKKYVDDNVGVGTWTDTSTNTGTNKTLDDFSNKVEADEVHIQIRNESGSTMVKGKLVYISGYNVGLDRTLVSLTDASSASTMPMLAMINDGDVVNNADGHATVSGRVFDIDTSAFSVGDSVYVSTTPGEISTRPSGTSDQVQRIGIVLRSQANNGVIQIIGAGRTNDIPNDIDHATDLQNVGTNAHSVIDTHLASTSDPHSVTASQVGLGNVSNVSTDDTAYNATSWNTNTDAPTKNAVRDKVETMDTAISSNTSASHAQSHNIASHSDTTATGAELNTLTGGTDTTLHDHDGISENTSARHTQGTDTALGAQAEDLDMNGNAITSITNIEYTGQSSSPIHTLTDQATITPNFNDGDVQTVTLTANRTLANPTNQKSGATYLIIVKQDAGGTNELTFGNNYKWSDGTAPTLSTGGNAVDILTFISDGTNMYGVFQGDFS